MSDQAHLFPPVEEKEFGVARDLVAKSMESAGGLPLSEADNIAVLLQRRGRVRVAGQEFQRVHGPTQSRGTKKRRARSSGRNLGVMDDSVCEIAHLKLGRVAITM